MKLKFYILLFCAVTTSVNYSQNLLFKSVTVEDGLSSSNANCMIQDKLGFIWIGTDNGLNRFDGSNFKVYRNDQNNPNSISDNSIWSLFEDRSGNIWAGTKGGVLNKYIPVLDKFERIELNENKYTENSITSILEDSGGLIWIGTYSQGLFTYETNTGKITNWRYDPNNKRGLSNNYISSLLQDESGWIWISTYNGLNRLNPKKINEGLDIFFASESNKNSISNNLVWKLTQSQRDKNLIWIGTASGLCSYELDKNKFTRIAVKPTYPLQFSNSFASVAEQKINGKDILWAATYGGLFKIDIDNNHSEQFIYDKKNPNSLLGNQIDQLLLDRSGVLWIATEKGVNYHSLKTQKFNKIFLQYSNDQTFQELLNSDVKAIVNGGKDEFYIAASEALFYLKIDRGTAVLKKFDELNNLNLWSLKKGNKDDLWIGTYGNGLIHFDLTTSKKQFIKIESPTFKTSAFNYIKALTLSKDGILWIGFWGGGLAAYDTENKTYKIWVTEISNPNSISYNDVWALHEDKLGRIWIGTNGGGLNLFIPKDNGIFLSWRVDQTNANSLINNSIHSITDISSPNVSETILLIGTENGTSKAEINNIDSDIYNFDIKFSNISDENVLIHNSVKGVLEDTNGFLWLSTNSGLIKINSANGLLFNFNNSDGLVSNIFNSGAYSKSENGLMIFGTIKGPVIFNPAEITLSEYEPHIVFTDFQIFNKSISPTENAPLHTSIAFAKEVNLTYDQNVITLKFASMDFNASSQIQYKYMLEGFDKDWVNSGSFNSATYTNLNPGSYTFKVKSTNSDGSWSNNLSSIKISVSPPAWRTMWAYMFYILLILLGIYAIRKFELSRNKLRNELKVKDLESKKIREIENMKSRFFANLSHEFRTPLMLIQGPLEQLLNDINSSRIEQYKLIHRNSKKLQNLIDQLLELSQLESSSIPVIAKKENIVPVLRGLFYSFASYAEQKNINISFTSSSDRLFAWFDRDKLDKILNNIFSNAFKFTPQGGTISVDVNTFNIKDSEYLQILVKDTGIGIPKNKIENIFDRFYQVDDSSRRSYGGSGIGLSLVRELVDLHRWKILADSEVGKGTEFTIQIPLDDFYLNENEKFQENFPLKLSENVDEKETIIVDQDQVKENLTSTGKRFNSLSNPTETKSTILIVEDSEDVRIYVSELLKDNYSILLSENGKKGLVRAFENLPDLIISDVMMPEMDGIEFCKNIKSDWRTSHIPVILLTAKVTSENKIEGLETGADDYLTKPFSFRELSVRIKNLLEQRSLLKEKYGKDAKFIPENITPNKADQEFLHKATSIVEKNISEPEFSSDQFAQEIFLSRSQLHRKLHSITGQSTGEFIRTVRLKKAAGLILENQFSITQIALEVGFNSPSHFTKAFKQLFGCLPSEFINRSNS